MDAQQELFTRVKLDLESIRHSVYDTFLPPDGTPYPFDYLGDFRQNNSFTVKSGTTGTVYATIHVWHNDPGQRGTVSKLIQEVCAVCAAIRHTDSYAWHIQSLDNQIIPDTTTKTPLLHGVIEVAFKFSRR